MLNYYLQAPGIAGGGRDKAEAAVLELAAVAPIDGKVGEGILKLQADKDPASAQLAFESAVGAEPAHRRARFALANLHLREKRNAAARAVWTDSLARDADDIYAVYHLGRLAALTGEELEDGLARLQRVLALPEMPEDVSRSGALWRSGQILAKLGQTEQARSALQQAIEQDAEIAPMAKADLDKLGRG